MVSDDRMLSPLLISSNFKIPTSKYETKRGVTFMVVVVLLVLWSTKGTTKGAHSHDGCDNADVENDDDKLKPVVLSDAMDFELQRRIFKRNGRFDSDRLLQRVFREGLGRG